MSFVSFQFAGFVLACLVLYYLLPRKRRYLALLAASYAFYLIACGIYILYMLATTITTYVAGRIMGGFFNECDARVKEPEIVSDRARKKEIKEAYLRRSRMVMIACLIINFGTLIVIKYSTFIISNINLFRITFFHATSLINMPVLLPLGVSFYTFQSMGYVIDVHYRRAEAETNPLRLALFVSFFPQIVQGPIGRYGALSKTLYEGHDFDWQYLVRGGGLVVSGLFKKLVIADRVSTYVTNSFNLYRDVDGGYLLLALFLYSFQLYADFSGGIDIATGVARCFGVDLAPNFERPFFAGSVSEYWRRWHISLSDWFRDFMFYPIAVSKRMMRHGKWIGEHVNKWLGKHYTLYVATAVVWFTTGLWHGNEWRYVVWGLLNGLIMCVSAELEPIYAVINRKIGWSDDGIPHRVFSAVRTFCIITFLRLFDLSHQGLHQVNAVLSKIFTAFGKVGLQGIEDLGLPAKELKVALVGCLVLMLVEIVQEREGIYSRLKKLPEAATWALFIVSIAFILVFGYYGLGYDAGDFIYMQF